MNLYLEWEDLERLDEDGDDIAPMVRVYFTVGGWVPYCKGTMIDPPEGGYYENICFVRAEIDPRSLLADPLTDAEIAKARAWFETDNAWERANALAMREADAYAD